MLIHQINLHLLLLLRGEELVILDSFGALRSNTASTKLILNLLCLERASSQIISLKLRALILRSNVHGLDSRLQLICHDGRLMQHLRLIAVSFLLDRLRVLISIVLVGQHQGRIANFVGLKLVILTLSLFSYNVNHLVSSIIIEIVFILVLRHDVLQVLYRIRVHHNVCANIRSTFA